VKIYLAAARILEQKITQQVKSNKRRNMNRPTTQQRYEHYKGRTCPNAPIRNSQRDYAEGFVSNVDSTRKEYHRSNFESEHERRAKAKQERDAWLKDKREDTFAPVLSGLVHGKIAALNEVIYGK